MADCRHSWRIFQWDAAYFEAKKFCKDCGEFLGTELNHRIPGVLTEAVGHLAREGGLEIWERELIYELRRSPDKVTAVQLSILRGINERIASANKLQTKR